MLSDEIRALDSAVQPQAAPGTWETALSHLPEAATVLVAGAGRGGLSLLLHRRGFRVTSLDLHPDHFAVPLLECGFADFDRPLPVESASQDVVLAIEVIEHLEAPWAFLRECMRVLRSGGRLIFTTPNVISLPSRLLFARNGLLPYFRYESFVGCYHVSPIFPWAVERWCETAGAELVARSYSRANWPDAKDVPRHWERRWMRWLKGLLPVGPGFGEIACFVIRKADKDGAVRIGQHYV